MKAGGRWALSPVTLAAVMITLGLVGNLATSTVQVHRWWWAPLLWASTGLLVAVALGVEWSRHRADATTGGRLLGELAGQVRRQWQNEAVLRRVRQPVPLRLRWRSTARPVAAAREVVLDEPGPGWVERPWEGDAGQIVDRFRQLPLRQLVVLGEPGAGKSVLALLLTLGLVEQPAEGEPVPVMLPIASWNPDAEGIEEFAVRRLAQEYPAAIGGAGGRRTVREALAEGQVLLVLDGLDELPASQHGRAVEALDVFAASGRPLVVTCRSREYERAVAADGAVLSRAAVIEIEPVGVPEAVQFLSHPAPARRRWEPVFDHLRRHPAGPLARVLSTPLMVSLARSAYRVPSTDPAALVRLGDQDSIASVLMDTYVTSAYDPAPGSDTSLRAYDPARAGRWLSCLAFHLYGAGQRELWWWQLSPGLLAARPRLTRRLVQTAVAAGLAAVAGIVTALAAGTSSGAWAAVTVVVTMAAAGVLRPLWPGAYPPAAPWPASARRRALRFWFGLVPGLLTGLIVGHLPVGLLGGAATALLFMMLPAWPVRSRSRRAAPRATLWARGRSALSAAAQYGLAGGSVFAVAAVIVPGPGVWISGATAAIVFGWAAACGAGLWTWIRYKTAHLGLAARGWLPWRLWAFLEDGHRRGMLRQAGTAWQFRHALLQDHLVTTARAHQLRARTKIGDWFAALRLADLLDEQGRTEEAIEVLRGFSDGGNVFAARQLADLLLAHGRVDEAITVLRPRAAGGFPPEAEQIVEILAEHGRMDEAVGFLQDRIDAGHHERSATGKLIDLFAEHGRVDEAVALLHARIKGPGGSADATRLIELLAGHGRVEEAIDLVQTLTGHWYDSAARRLADLLVEQGRADQAIDILRARAAAGDRYAVVRLADLLAEQGRADEAIDALRAHPLDVDVVVRLAEMLAARNRVEEAIALLRARVDAHDRRAVRPLADMLAEHGRLDEAVAVLQPRSDVRGWDTTLELADLLAGHGRVDEALALLRGRADADLLPHNGGLADQRRLAAADRLADLLAEHGRIDELRRRADAHGGAAARRLADLLAEQGHVDDAIALLRPLAKARDGRAEEQLINLLAHHGREADLRALAGRRHTYALHRLADLLIEQGRTEEAIAFLGSRADASDWNAVARLTDLLARRRHLHEDD